MNSSFIKIWNSIEIRINVIFKQKNILNTNFNKSFNYGEIER